MTLEELQKSATDYIYKEVAKNTNLLLGKNKSSQLSTGLFLKLPIEVSFQKSPEPLAIATQNLPSLMERLSAYVQMGNVTTVYFTIFYDNPNHHAALLRCIESQPIFWAFVYLHEVQHILRKHVTKTYDTLMKRQLDSESQYPLINIAEDHAINYSLKDLFVISQVKHSWPAIEEIACYNAQYHSDQLSDIEILKLLKSTPTTSQPFGEDFSKISIPGSSPSIQPNTPATIESDKLSTTSDDADTSLSDLAHSLEDLIRTNTKGTATGDLFENVFKSVKVNTAWFKKLKASFKKQVFYRTHDYLTSWSALNNTYRHIYKSPKRTYVDGKIQLIISVDHSGSMATEDLQKLLYLIESEAKRISEIHVLIHDTKVLRQFQLSNEFDITKSPEFQSALATRFTVGGTSHSDVFRVIQETVKDPSKVIYLSFSDNYSDIEQSFSKYPIMRKITNFWVSPVNNPVRVLGTNILMS